jgi:hypothetical protein
MDNECAFEPDISEILCVECGKGTGQTGTCKDLGVCMACREDFISSGVAIGFTRREAEISFSEILITMIEGRGYNSKYKPRRVLHFARSGTPVCGIKGEPHPVTTNVSESNCKRCLKIEENARSTDDHHLSAR